MKLNGEKILLTLLIILFGCKGNIDNFNDGQVKVLNIEQYQNNGISEFVHYIYIEDRGEPGNFLRETAQNYIDTLKQNKPVSKIVFVNSEDGFSKSPEANDLETIRDNTFAEISDTFQYDNTQGKFEKLTRFGQK